MGYGNGGYGMGGYGMGGYGMGGHGMDGFGMGGFPSGGSSSSSSSSSSDGNYGNHAPAVAASSVGLGPDGGYQVGQISPVSFSNQLQNSFLPLCFLTNDELSKFQAGPGIESRFGDSIDAPNDGAVGTYSSSSTSQSVGPDGKVVSHKTTTVAVTKDGKTTYKTIKE